jgi:hypothetical protein
MLTDIELNEPHAGKSFAGGRAVRIDRAALSGFAVPAPLGLGFVDILDPHHIATQRARTAAPTRLLPGVVDARDGLIDDGLIDCRIGVVVHKNNTSDL